MGQQGRSQFDIVNALGVLVPGWRSHRNRVKKQALFRDLSGNGYVVTLTCFAASIDVRDRCQKQGLVPEHDDRTLHSRT